MKRKVCVFTGTRAEYGLLKPLMSELKRDKNVKLQTLVSGMHLSKDFGLTYKEILKDGFKIDAKVDIDLKSDTPEGISRSTGLGTMRYAKTFARLKPDLVVVLGDRFEAFAAATAAMIARIPIAHLYGGEATYGLIDEPIRHSITKMSHLHFASLEEYRNRIIQLGESPQKVFKVGAIGLDNIRQLKLLTKKELERDLGVKFLKRNLLVTFHPVTLEREASGQQIKNLLAALQECKDTFIIFTKGNADTDGRIINKMIDQYVKKYPNTSKAFVSLGQMRYLSCVKAVDAVVGNSSSGIVEVPSFKIPTVNIGRRQAGRVQAASVINCAPRKKDISRALRKAFSEDFRKKLKTVKNPYGDGKSTNRISKILKDCSLDNILMKSFYDMKGKNGEK